MITLCCYFAKLKLHHGVFGFSPGGCCRSASRWRGGRFFGVWVCVCLLFVCVTIRDDVRYVIHALLRVWYSRMCQLFILDGGGAGVKLTLKSAVAVPEDPRE